MYPGVDSRGTPHRIMVMRLQKVPCGAHEVALSAIDSTEAWLVSHYSLCRVLALFVELCLLLLRGIRQLQYSFKECIGVIVYISCTNVLFLSGTEWAHLILLYYMHVCTFLIFFMAMPFKYCNASVTNICLDFS